ncbi:MAG: tRNA pseudouridine(38-40) synthase TruA [Bacteroidota bacterium]
MTSRYLLHIAYNGKNYHGWQKQHNARTVQQEVEEKLSLLLGENIETLGCGRTDTGVHAKSYYLHFDSRVEIEQHVFLFKLNQILPYDIAAYGISKVDAEFNARFDALWRTYEYCITAVKDPFLHDYAWYQYGALDMETMNACAQKLIGTHDFECFSKVHTQVNNFVCEVTEAYWQRQNHTLVFTITANRFLRNMVRAIVGTLVDAGRGKISQPEFEAILNSKSRSEAGQSVPAHGLYLTRIQYK